MNRIWRIKENGFDKEINNLAEKLNVNHVIASLLLQRGINTFEQAKAFFRPSLNHLHDPFLMKDMDKAVERLGQALKKEEKILVYGDYDVDGTTSVAMVYTFLKKYSKRLDYYIPDRYSEGYGISLKGVEYAIEKDVSLIIALDCGIKAADKVAHAKKYGIDFIICDHHTPGDKLPDAEAVLDPEREDDTYPFSYLSGCGVAFKLLQAYVKQNNISENEVFCFLDLVAVSIASDIVPMIDENRILTYFGLQKLSSNPLIGLKAIIRIAGLEGKNISVDDIVFKIGPRINAAGRIESGKQAVALLVSDDPAEAVIHCERINNHNLTRRNIDKIITEEASIEARSLLHKYKHSIILYNPKWHKGVVGIVASRLIEHYYKPTIILTESNGLATGSARSIAGFDLYRAISACSGLLESFGGHRYAAGLTLKPENITKFRERFDEIVRETVTSEQMVPQVEIDTELNFKDISPKLFRILKQFEPFGPENMNPVFFAENVSDKGYARLVGGEKEHLQLELIQEEQYYKTFKAIAFNQASSIEKIKNGNGFDIAFSLLENTFRDITSLQLNIKDIKIDRKTH